MFCRKEYKKTLPTPPDPKWSDWVYEDTAWSDSTKEESFSKVELRSRFITIDLNDKSRVKTPFSVFGSNVESSARTNLVATVVPLI